MTTLKLFQLATLERWFGKPFEANTVLAYLDDRITFRELVRLG
jgi:hypothetical protein